MCVGSNKISNDCVAEKREWSLPVTVALISPHYSNLVVWLEKLRSRAGAFLGARVSPKILSECCAPDSLFYTDVPTTHGALPLGGPAGPLRRGAAGAASTRYSAHPLPSVLRLRACNCRASSRVLLR